MTYPSTRNWTWGAAARSAAWPVLETGAEARIVFNGELRWRGLPIWRRQHLYLGLVAFGDLGQIFARDALPTSDGWRGGSGLGLRCHWQSTIVRADYGTSGGRRALYITFSQVF